MLQRVLLTPQGHQKLQDELDHHKKVLRPQVIQEIAEARSHGDLSENAEYDYAKDRQGMIEARIAELETSMALAEVIDVRRLAPSDEVVFGSRVKLVDLDTDEELEYQIVGKLESDVKQNRISSPLP